MRLFVSYARADISICRQLIATLKDVHEIWSDELLFGGMDWWEEIEYRLQWADGLIYLISPEAVQSEYCIKEFEVARKLGKRIFPVLIQNGTKITDELMHYQITDLSHDTGRIFPLLNALTIAERNVREGRQEIRQQTLNPANTAPVETTGLRLGDKVSLVIQANNEGNYQRAIDILSQIQREGNIPKAILPVIEKLSNQIQVKFHQSTHLSLIEYDYEIIMEMILSAETRQYGIEAFLEFSKEFPNYDPHGLAAIVQEWTKPTPAISLETFPELPAPFIWCTIPGTQIVLKNGRNFTTPPFYIAQQMLTVGQFRHFLEASDGYDNLQWWGFSGQAHDWAKQNQLHLDPHRSLDLAVLGVNWYDVTAYCNWLTFRTSIEIRLPTEQEWQTTSQTAKSTMISSSGHTGPLARPKINPSLWEWCFNDWESGNCEWVGNQPRVLCQGVFSTHTLTNHQLNQRMGAHPHETLPQAGFRIMSTGHTSTINN